tara:strand:- start:489 stop:845 length:357 start_codon:yes stop_codon:yes gene_type:complete
MGYELKDGDVAIIINPELDEQGDWTGILKTGMVFGDGQHPLAMRSAMDYALTMAAASEVLEEYPELMEYFDDARHNLLKELFPKQYAESELAVEEELDYTKEGNVIKLTKWTKTLGEA